MCHRELRLWKARQCGHLTCTADTNVDCGQSDCYNSAAHPPDCPPASCRCRRYFTQPERIVTHEADAKCPRCQ
ncbi:uncharacterized protein BXZ73DRAFT_95645 [Epithele typhae]|uniref:uncharacterized protein n=1 Tax=Epithele typhae TaxID=378194 RepID=UPI002007ACAF|nr:uncharacterized protein BXZ73DRAFT_95645 [Epithele typhae]KAH9946144.1 hypothetical protein BXZ73DRAFT_95645 [Epithele typhae]